MVCFNPKGFRYLPNKIFVESSSERIADKNDIFAFENSNDIFGQK